MKYIDVVADACVDCVKINVFEIAWLTDEQVRNCNEINATDCVGFFFESMG